MSLITKVIYQGILDFPIKGARFVIEDNIGDIHPIHIHFGELNGIADTGYPRGLPNMRIHFSYEEFNELIEKMIETGKL